MYCHRGSLDPAAISWEGGSPKPTRTYRHLSWVCIILFHPALNCKDLDFLKCALYYYWGFRGGLWKPTPIQHLKKERCSEHALTPIKVYSWENGPFKWGSQPWESPSNAHGLPQYPELCSYCPQPSHPLCLFSRRSMWNRILLSRLKVELATIVPQLHGVWLQPFSLVEIWIEAGKVSPWSRTVASGIAQGEAFPKLSLMQADGPHICSSMSYAL